MKDPGLFQEAYLLFGGMVSRMDHDWVRWSVEKIAIPAMVSAIAVFVAFDRAQSEQELQVQLLKAEVTSQRQLIIETKTQIGAMQAQVLELLKYQWSAEAADQAARGRR